MRLYYARLNTGEWIVGEDGGDSEDGITLKRPVVVVPATSAEGKRGVVFVPFDPMNPHGEVVFSPEEFQAYVPEDFYHKDMEKRYIEATTNLVLPGVH